MLIWNPVSSFVSNVGTVWTSYRRPKRVSFHLGRCPRPYGPSKPYFSSVEDVIDFDEKENEKLVLKITEWRKVRLRFEDRFKQHLLDDTKSSEVDEEFQSILATVSLNGQMNLKGNINPNYLSAMVSSIR